MKRLILLVFALGAINHIWGQILIDGIYYNLAGDSAVVVVPPTGPKYSGDIVIPASVKYQKSTYFVKEIGSGAFYNSYITSISMPNSIKRIGNNAFFGCYKLKSITIPDGVISIGDQVFSNSRNISTITFGASLSQFGSGIFGSCDSLSEINVSPQNKVFSSIDGVLFSYNKDSLIKYPVGKKWSNYTIPNMVKKIGSSSFVWCQSLTSIDIPESVEIIGTEAFLFCENLISVTMPNGVKVIGDKAFGYCYNLSSITIGTNVTSIADDAFKECYALTSIIWNAKCATRYRFEDPSKITTFIFGDEVEVIPDLLCNDMSSLTSITIPKNVKEIGWGAFGGCTGVTSITWNAKNCRTAPNLSRQIKNLTFGDEVEVIPAELCASNEYLTSIVIPNSVKEIGDAVFCECINLETVEMGNSVENIGNYAFLSCAKLSSCTLPNSVLKIGDNAFAYCPLTKINIPDRTKYIGRDAFIGCTNLRTATIGNNVSYIGNTAFYYCINLTAISIPDSVTSIGYGTFGDCYKLSSVHLGSGIKSIEENAFEDSSIKHITIPEKVDTIHKWAFSGCDSIESVVWNATHCKHGISFRHVKIFSFGENVEIVPTHICEYTDITTITLPDKVKLIGDSAFFGCGFSSITCLATNPPTCGEDCFYYVDRSIPLYVPEESISVYQTADVWKEFYNIKALPTALPQITNPQLQNTNKIIKDNQLLILRDGKTYNAQGGEIK